MRKCLLFLDMSTPTATKTKKSTTRKRPAKAKTVRPAPPEIPLLDQIAAEVEAESYFPGDKLRWLIDYTPLTVQRLAEATGYSVPVFYKYMNPKDAPRFTRETWVPISEALGVDPDCWSWSLHDFKMMVLKRIEAGSTVSGGSSTWSDELDGFTDGKNPVDLTLAA